MVDIPNNINNQNFIDQNINTRRNTSVEKKTATVTKNPFPQTSETRYGKLPQKLQHVQRLPDTSRLTRTARQTTDLYNKTVRKHDALDQAKHDALDLAATLYGTIPPQANVSTKTPTPYGKMPTRYGKLPQKLQHHQKLPMILINPTTSKPREIWTKLNDALANKYSVDEVEQDRFIYGITENHVGKKTENQIFVALPGKKNKIYFLTVNPSNNEIELLLFKKNFIKTSCTKITDRKRINEFIEKAKSLSMPTEIFKFIIKKSDVNPFHNPKAVIDQLPKNNNASRLESIEGPFGVNPSPIKYYFFQQGGNKYFIDTTHKKMNIFHYNEKTNTLHTSTNTEFKQKIEQEIKNFEFKNVNKPSTTQNLSAIYRPTSINEPSIIEFDGKLREDKNRYEKIKNTLLENNRNTDDVPKITYGIASFSNKEKDQPFIAYQEKDAVFILYKEKNNGLNLIKITENSIEYTVKEKEVQTQTILNLAEKLNFPLRTFITPNTTNNNSVNNINLKNIIESIIKEKENDIKNIKGNLGYTYYNNQWHITISKAIIYSIDKEKLNMDDCLNIVNALSEYKKKQRS